MIEVPPPTRTCTPFSPSSLMTALKAMSWIFVIARSAGEASKAVLTLRGISCVVWWRTK